MPSLRPVYLFVLKLTVLYGLLLIPWPGVMTAYRAAFAATGNVLFRTLGGDGRVYFKTIATPVEGRDTDIRLENIRTRAGGSMDPPMNSRLVGYLPTCFTIALIASTPIPWRRRAPALLIGALLISLFVAVTVWLRLINALSNPDVLRVFDLGPTLKTGVVVLLKVLAMSPVTAYIAPVVIWAIVALRRDDFPRLIENASRASSDSPIKSAVQP